MASKLLGRAACPLKCGNDAAHVKIKTDKAEGKTAHPYIHCPGCGINVHSRSDEQTKHMLAITRREKGAPDALETPPKPSAPTPAPDTPPVPSARPAGLFDTLWGGAQ